jgi:hypothetical protein
MKLIHLNFLVLGVLTLTTSTAIHSQTYVQMSPSSNQTVTQPSGTNLSVNNLAVPGAINLGSSGSFSQSYGGGTNLFLGYNSANGGYVTTRVGPLVLYDSSADYGALINVNSSNLYLGSLQGGIILDNQGNNITQVLISSGSNFVVTDADGSTSSVLCVTSQLDFVGIAGPNSCNQYDLLDISNRETFGNGNMHWWADGAVPVWNADQSATIGGWNVGISNPSTGKLSLDSTTDHDGLAQVTMGTLTLAASGAGAIKFADNSVQSTAWNGTTLGGDYAEAVDVLGDRAKYEPGDVIVIDAATPGRFAKSDKAYSRLVAGVYSTKPGLVGRRTTADRPNKDAEVPMAMMGIVPTKVSTENGPIEPGDLLVSSSTPGFAMKGTDDRRLTGAVIGKALAPLSSGSGVLEVLVSLQ